MYKHIYVVVEYSQIIVDIYMYIVILGIAIPYDYVQYTHSMVLYMRYSNRPTGIYIYVLYDCRLIYLHSLFNSYASSI